MKNETKYCGSCDREQESGEKCKICKKTTVTWNKNKQKLADIKIVWKNKNPLG